MTKEKVGIAVIGLGFVGGQAHVPAVKKIQGAQLVAVMDVSKERAKKVASKYNVQYYTDVSKTLEDPKINALIIATPTPFHYELTSEAMDRGKHVLCEMPLTSTIQEAKKLQKKATKTRTILMPDLNFRFTPNYVKMKELIDQGMIGTPIAFTFSEYLAAKDLEAQWPVDSWAWDVKRSGGYPDFTLSVYSLDLLRWLLSDEIKEVKWMSNYAPLKHFNKFTGYNKVGIIRFSNGAVGTLHYSSTVVQGEETSRLEVFGDNTKTIQATWNNSLILTGSEKQTWDFKGKGTRAWGHRQIDSYFVECILQGKQPSLTIDDAIKAQSTALEMVKNHHKKLVKKDNEYIHLENILSIPKMMTRT